MEPLVIVEDCDAIEDRVGGLGAVPKMLAVNGFFLEGTPETLRRRVVVAISPAVSQ